MSKRKKIILIANSELVSDINAYIHPEDIIVRFNIPLSSSLPKTGNRTDLLFVSNSVDIVQKKMKINSKFMKFIQSIDNNFKIFFPYSDELIKINKPYYTIKSLFILKKMKLNYNNSEYLSFLKSQGFNNIEILEEHYYLNLKNKIDPESNKILSTGSIAVQYFLNHVFYQDYDIYLNGFSFEGWDGHSWDHEKKYINELILSNKIKIFPARKTDDSIKNP